MKKTIILLAIILTSCEKDEEKIVFQIQEKMDLAVHEDTSDIGEVLIIEIEDEAQFVGSDEMVKMTNCFPPFPDSILKLYEKKMLTSDIKNVVGIKNK